MRRAARAARIEREREGAWGVCPTGKKWYANRPAAPSALTRCRSCARRGDHQRGERRIYKCPRCRGWHLTSQVGDQARRRMLQ